MHQDEWVDEGHYEEIRHPLLKETDVRTEPVIGWRVWKITTRAHMTYESQSMASLATLIKMVVSRPIEEALEIIASDVALHPWGYNHYPWRPYERMEALHEGGRTYQMDEEDEEHVAPMHGCSCGLWAFKDLETLRERFGQPQGDMVCGTVALWGKIVQTTHGYRAQYAYPQELEYISNGAEPTDIDVAVANAISTKYGIPCVAVPPWRSNVPFRGLQGITATSASASSIRPWRVSDPLPEWPPSEWKAERHVPLKMERDLVQLSVTSFIWVGGITWVVILILALCHVI